MNKTLLALASVTVTTLCAAQNAAVVSAAYQRPTFINVAPGQVITFYVHGIGTGLTKRVNAQSLPLPTTLAGISAQYIATPIQPISILSVEPIYMRGHSPGLFVLHCRYGTDPNRDFSGNRWHGDGSSARSGGCAVL